MSYWLICLDTVGNKSSQFAERLDGLQTSELEVAMYTLIVIANQKLRICTRRDAMKTSRAGDASHQ